MSSGEFFEPAPHITISRASRLEINKANSPKGKAAACHDRHCVLSATVARLHCG
jgi:hypothetical protein